LELARRASTIGEKMPTTRWAAGSDSESSRDQLSGKRDLD
jgi:hypothetical protein